MPLDCPQYNFVELKRLGDIKKPGSQAETGSFFVREGGGAVQLWGRGRCSCEVGGGAVVGQGAVQLWGRRSCMKPEGGEGREAQPGRQHLCEWERGGRRGGSGGWMAAGGWGGGVHVG